VIAIGTLAFAMSTITITHTTIVTQTAAAMTPRDGESSQPTAELVEAQLAEWMPESVWSAPAVWSNPTPPAVWSEPIWTPSQPAWTPTPTVVIWSPTLAAPVPTTTKEPHDINKNYFGVKFGLGIGGAVVILALIGAVVAKWRRHLWRKKHAEEAQVTV
jgi:hypothetical protein